MQTLAASPLFHRLTPEELRALERAAHEQNFAENQEIFREGDTGDGVYIVKSGQVQISGLVGDKRHIFSRVGPGEIFGEMAVLENKPRSASATASMDSTVYFIRREE